jgi:xanthine dehydrogenase YagR molybdenum-binding subunit
MTTALIGQPISRTDGGLKVTGGAKYAAEFELPGLLHAAVVESTIANGRITTIETADAERAPGVRAVLTHRNAPKLPYRAHKAVVDPSIGERLHVLQDDRVYHQGQCIALVVAETLEQATDAASRVRAALVPESATTVFEEAFRSAVPLADRRRADTSRGDPEGALEGAEIKVSENYLIPREHHNPMELHATIAAWEGARLTLWDKTQWVGNTRAEIAAIFGIPEENIRVVSLFVGGAFGSALRTWPHVTLAAMAAQHLRRPVKLVLSRRGMYGGTGFRPQSLQRVSLGADRNGRLQATIHEGTHETSVYEEFGERLLDATKMLYSCPNVATRQRSARMNVNTPTPMRGPGEASGIFALESALDELAYSLGIGPVELRLRNYAERDEHEGKPFSSKSLRECYRIAADRFGWSGRSFQPATTRDGRWLIGTGMATATWHVNYVSASALARLFPDVTAEIATAASDMGPGTWTSMTQVAAETLGLPVERIRVRLGDSILPKAPVHGGSLTMASVGSAVRRLVGAYGAGRIVNPKLARSQMIGGMVGGIGMALMEHTIVDERFGRVVNANLAEYLVPVHADTPTLDVIFVEEDDPHINPLGVKGVGELALVGVAPAIANAVFHATGRRVRELPITPEKLLLPSRA